MAPWTRRPAVLMIVGLLLLAAWPGVGRAQAPAAQDTLQAVIERGELIVGTFDFFARQVAHRVVFMDEGRIVETGSPRDLFDRPQNARTQSFLSKIL